MRKKYIFGKKLYISVLTTILILLTTVATTFAWIGVFANSTFETFDIGIRASNLEEYGVEVSLDGVNFKPEIDFKELEKTILKNFGYQDVNSLTSDEIDYLFNNLNQDQCTTVPVVSNNKIVNLGEFKDILGNTTTKFIKFDIYVSPINYYDKGTSSEFLLDVFLDKNALIGNKKSHVLINQFTYPSDFNNPYNGLIDSGDFILPLGMRTITANETITSARVSSASAARLAFEKYEVVDKGHPEQYTASSKPKSAVIYQDSYEYPLYDESNNEYSFGAILPDDYNFAVGYYNSTEYLYYKYKLKSVTVPDSILNTRSVIGEVPDLRLTSKTNHLIDSSNTDEQIGINQMMKMTCYFWFEGWDADCFPAINHSKVYINIGFLMKNDEDF